MMPSFEGVKQALTFDSVLIAIAVVLVILGVIKAFVSGIEAWKKISLRDRVKKLEDEVEKINERLEVGNRRFKHQSEDMGQILQTLSALQVHFISGNDHDKLRQSNEELVAYMNTRATRDAEEI